MYSPVASIVIVSVSGMIIGRMLSVCGAIGVMMSEWFSGARIGAPRLNEYPVEPVGVLTATPSAQKEQRNSFPTYTLILISFTVLLFCNVISFNPMPLSISLSVAYEKSSTVL